MERQAKLNTYHMSQFAYFLDKLEATPDGDGTLLDHTLLLYGSGLSDGNLHLMYDVPTLVVGSKASGIQGGRFLRAPEGTPLTNLQLSLMNKMGVHMETFGDSNGELNLVTGV